MTTQPQAGWRTLSDAELAGHPEARLGGALAVLFWGAVVMVAMFALVIGWLIVFGNFFTVAMMSRMMFSGASTTSIVTGISMVPQVAFLAWACLFAVMTMGRRQATPTASSVMIVIWAMTAIGAQIATRIVIAQNNFDLVSQATLLPYIMIDIVLVAAFCGYMSGGSRPNVFFRRRVRA